ncbi:hypothetical protein Bca101_059198 [Brassica carinata]
MASFSRLASNSPIWRFGSASTRRDGELVLLRVQFTNQASWRCSNLPRWRVALVLIQLTSQASWKCSNSPRGRFGLASSPVRQSGKLEVLQLAEMVSCSRLGSNSPIWRVGSAPTRRDSELALPRVQLTNLASWKCSNSPEWRVGLASRPTRHHGHSQFNDAVPKVEFEIPSVDPEDAAAYWEACGGLKPARAGLWTPPPFIPNNEADFPSKSCSNGLASIRHF